MIKVEDFRTIPQKDDNDSSVVVDEMIQFKEDSMMANKESDLIDLIQDECKYAENYLESSAHFPRIKIELDRLNYANESINNLELEYEESKREFIISLQEFDSILMKTEKSLGNCVKKAQPYYEFRIELNDLKQHYISSKNLFETSQELYVAAKSMKEYCEDSLERYETSGDLNSFEKIQEKEALLKMLNVAIGKVSESESLKQKRDLEQIESQEKFEKKLKEVEYTEKNLKSSIEKSRTFYELKAKQNKELKFLYSKIEGLKSCLKEAKNTYQQSLNNLELISTEIHALRNENKTQISFQEKSLASPVDSSKILLTSNLENFTNEQSVNTEALNDNTQINNQSLDNKSMTNAIQYSNKKYGISLISDEEIENLRLESFLRNYEKNLLNKNK